MMMMIIQGLKEQLPYFVTTDRIFGFDDNDDDDGGIIHQAFFFCYHFLLFGTCSKNPNPKIQSIIGLSRVTTTTKTSFIIIITSSFSLFHKCFVSQSENVL